MVSVSYLQVAKLAQSPGFKASGLKPQVKAPVKPTGKLPVKPTSAFLEHIILFYVLFKNKLEPGHKPKLKL